MIQLSALLPLIALFAGLAFQSPENTAVLTRNASIEAHLREHLETLREQRGFPGVSVAFVLPDGEEIAVAVGYDSKRKETPLTPSHVFLSGSVGKTYVTAMAHHWIGLGKLKLEDKASQYLGEESWWAQMPNAEDMTVQQLLRHESGLPRYIYEDGFWTELLTRPNRVWQPHELLAYVFGREAVFPAGEGWAYADTNYIVIGMIIERISGKSFYDSVQETFIDPLGLKETFPTNSRELPNMVQGHIVSCRRFGYGPETLKDGVFIDNIQFEWCGGGWASTPLDLTRWTKHLYGGTAMQGDYLDTLLDHVPAPRLGPGKRYGLGVMVDETEMGLVYGHEGFMPGYLSATGLLLDADLAGTVQFNTDDSRSTGDPAALLHELFELVSNEL